MEVSPEELHDLMQRPGPRAFELVDVRDGSEFVISRLHWAELISLDRLAIEAPKRFSDKDKPIVVSGARGLVPVLAKELSRGGVASAVRDRPNPARLVAVGELSLSGEVRAVTQHAQRRAEADRLGYRTMIDTSSRDLAGALSDIARSQRPEPGDEPGF